MKLLNNDIKELNAGLLRGCQTGGNNGQIDDIVDDAVNYLKIKYKKDIYELSDWEKEWVDYLNSLKELDYIELFDYTKNLFQIHFGEEQGLKYYIDFTFGLLEDGENYSDVLNKSQEINQMLLKDYNVGFKYYARNHKYRIGKRISHVSRNLGEPIKGETYENFYDFWEGYNPK